MTEHAHIAEKVEVNVGGWLPTGEFTGTIVRFRGEEVGSYTDHSEARSNDDRGTTYTLYRCGDGYRVHIERWTRWQGESSESWLEPFDPDSKTPFTEAEAREAFPALFAALGMANVIDLDED